MTQIEFVSSSEVKLVKQNSSDYDVALAAWVSNFDREKPPVEKPHDSHFRWHGEHTKRYSKAEADKSYPDVKRYQDRVGGLINFLYRERHMSPFEHGSFTFYVDTPIFVAREFMRHRTWSYNETSGRYKELAPRFYLVDSERPIVKDPDSKVGQYKFLDGTDDQYGTTFAATQIAYQSAWSAYQMMLNKGVATEVARNVLPVGIMTSFYATANPRNVMQFLLLRNDPAALYEIREVAKSIEAQFAKAMPLTYAAYKKFDWRDEKAELAELRLKVAQLEAEITYTDLAPLDVQPALFA